MSSDGLSSWLYEQKINVRKIKNRAVEAIPTASTTYTYNVTFLVS